VTSFFNCKRCEGEGHSKLYEKRDRKNQCQTNSSFDEPKRYSLFVFSLARLSAIVAASTVMDLTESIGILQNFSHRSSTSLDASNDSTEIKALRRVSLVVRLLSEWCSGNTKLMLQVALHLRGNYLVSFLEHHGGLTGLAANKLCHSSTLQEMYAVVYRETERYLQWQVAWVGTTWGSTGYYSLVYESLQRLCSDYIGEIRRHGLQNPGRWNEFELSHFQMGYCDFHFPEFLLPELYKRYQMLWMNRAPDFSTKSLVSFFIHDQHLLYGMPCPIAYDYLAARDTRQTPLFLIHFVPYIEPSDVTLFLMRPDGLTLTDTLTQPPQEWLNQPTYTNHTHRDPGHDCQRHGNGGELELFCDCSCNQLSEDFFFWLLKRVVASTLNGHHGVASLLCLKAGLLMQDHFFRFCWRASTRMYEVDVCCHLASNLAKVGMDLRASLFCLSKAFSAVTSNSGLIYCLTTTHSVLTSAGALQQGTRIWDHFIKDCAYLPHKSRFWFLCALEHLKNRAEYIENILLNFYMYNVYHTHCRTGPCFNSKTHTQSKVRQFLKHNSMKVLQDVVRRRIQERQQQQDDSEEEDEEAVDENNDGSLDGDQEEEVGNVGEGGSGGAGNERGGGIADGYYDRVSSSETSDFDEDAFAGVDQTMFRHLTGLAPSTELSREGLDDFLAAQEFHAAWDHPKKLAEEVQLFEKEVEQIEKSSIGHHGSIHLAYYRLMCELFKCAIHQGEGNFSMHKAGRVNLSSYLSQCFHLMDTNGQGCICDLHQDQMIPPFCLCNTDVPAMRLKATALTCLIESDPHYMSTTNMTQYIDQMQAMEHFSRRFCVNNSDALLHDVYLTQVLAHCILWSPMALPAIRHSIERALVHGNTRSRGSSGSSQKHYRLVLVEKFRQIFCAEEIGPGIYKQGARHFASRGEFLAACASDQLMECCTNVILHGDCEKNLIAQTWLNQLQFSMERGGVNSDSGGNLNFRHFFKTLTRQWPEIGQLFSLGYFSCTQIYEPPVE
jgi:hypothetical protein